ncbi:MULTISPECIES: TrmH family RNA methyltransferase [Streptococcus]|uniref:TrmH family RNA methyltransferase n=1 Tax=Streptococcus porcorum TaxID=701526 RepID=A0ABV2JGD7_9STRE|nr:RNA methyltransferase [Streptococcus sp.]MDY3823593.1 RNA methyltransferase [Streptococcus sp.]
MTIITSKSNNLIKKTKKLLQKKHRKHSYLIEGWHLLEEAQKYGAEILNLFTLELYADRVTHFDQVHLVTNDVLKELSDTATPQGVVAEIAYPNLDFPQQLKGKFLILEDVQDPGNVGTIIRTADAAGFDAIFLSEKTADLYNAKTLRAMQGSHFHLPIYRQDIFKIIKQLQEDHICILATTLAPQSVDYKAIQAPSSFALVMGNEGSGISKKMAEQADHLIHITMPGQAESLNVAVAAGIVIFSLV